MLNYITIYITIYELIFENNSNNPSNFCHSFRDFFKPRIKDIVILELNVFCQIVAIQPI